MCEILTNWGEDTLLNTINLLNGRVFEQEKDGFKPFPPGVYFSDDITYMKSMVNHYSIIRYQISKKLKGMSIDDFWDYLESEKVFDGYFRESLQNEYLIEYKERFKNHGHHKLITLISDMNIKRTHFIYKGMYLFRVMPEYFIRFS